MLKILMEENYEIRIINHFNGNKTKKNQSPSVDFPVIFEQFCILRRNVDIIPKTYEGRHVNIILNNFLFRLFETPWIAAFQAPPPMGFSRQEYWSGVPLPSPG